MPIRQLVFGTRTAWPARPVRHAVKLPPSCRARTAPARRHNSSSSGNDVPPNKTSPSGARTTASTRASRILDRLPPSLRKYADRLRDAPVSHVVAFLALHEITAVAPLVALAALFHYYADAVVPAAADWVGGRYGEQVREGLGRFERYFRRKGWFGFRPGEEENALGREADGESGDAREDVLRRWAGADPRYRIVVEVALAYVIVKVLLPVRIVVSLWATPWFAGVLGRIRRLGRRKAGP